MDLENEAIFPGDSMAFNDLGNLLSKRGDFWKTSGKRSDSDERGDLVPRCLRIQFQTISGNHTTLFQTPNTLLRCRIGHLNLSSELGNRHPWIPLQELQNFNIFEVSQYFF